MACRQRGDFSEGEYYFRRVIKEGRELERAGRTWPRLSSRRPGDSRRAL
jgi:hypothetical protein